MNKITFFVVFIAILIFSWSYLIIRTTILTKIISPDILPWSQNNSVVNLLKIELKPSPTILPWSQNNSALTNIISPDILPWSQNNSALNFPKIEVDPKSKPTPATLPLSQNNSALTQSKNEIEPEPRLELKSRAKPQLAIDLGKL